MMVLTAFVVFQSRLQSKVESVVIAKRQNGPASFLLLFLWLRLLLLLPLLLCWRRLLTCCFRCRFLGCCCWLGRLRLPSWRRHRGPYLNCCFILLFLLLLLCLLLQVLQMGWQLRPHCLCCCWWWQLRPDRCCRCRLLLLLLLLVLSRPLYPTSPVLCSPILRRRRRRCSYCLSRRLLQRRLDPLVLCHLRRRLPLVVERLDVGPALDQQLHSRSVPPLRRQHQRVGALARLAVDGRARVDQRAHGLDVALLRRKVEGVHVVHGGGADLGAVRQQELDGIL